MSHSHCFYLYPWFQSAYYVFFIWYLRPGFANLGASKPSLWTISIRAIRFNHSTNCAFFVSHSSWKYMHQFFRLANQFADLLLHVLDSHFTGLRLLVGFFGHPILDSVLSVGKCGPWESQIVTYKHPLPETAEWKQRCWASGFYCWWALTLIVSRRDLFFDWLETNTQLLWVLEFPLVKKENVCACWVPP